MLFDRPARTLDPLCWSSQELWEGTGSVGTHSPNDVLLAKDLKPTLAVGFFSPARARCAQSSCAYIRSASKSRLMITQQVLLRDAMRRLDMTRDAFADRIGSRHRAL